MSQFFLWFKEMKQLYGFCPCCGELFRLSDAQIFTKGHPPHTIFDEIDAKKRSLDKRENKFAEQENVIREVARRRGRARAARNLKKLSSYMHDPHVNANDIKVLFDPIKYLVFHGLTKERCTLIELVDHLAQTPSREKVHKSIQRAIEAGNIEWKTFRVNGEGMITQEE